MDIEVAKKLIDLENEKLEILQEIEDLDNELNEKEADLARYTIMIKEMENIINKRR